MPERIACGCKPGKHLCQTAEMLWAYHSSLYKAGCSTLSAFFRAEYDAHYDNPNKSLKQSAVDAAGKGKTDA